jgi:hypothetical protein
MEGDTRPEILTIESQEQVPAPNMPDEFVVKPATSVAYQDVPEEFTQKFEEYLGNLGLGQELVDSIIRYEENSDARFFRAFRRLLVQE